MFTTIKERRSKVPTIYVTVAPPKRLCYAHYYPFRPNYTNPSLPPLPNAKPVYHKETPKAEYFAPRQMQYPDRRNFFPPSFNGYKISKNSEGKKQAADFPFVQAGLIQEHRKGMDDSET
jgi:hypothetical protein